MGNAVWELYCSEHAVSNEGTLLEPPHELEWVETFFNLSEQGRYVPRCLFVDLESSVIGMCMLKFLITTIPITTFNNIDSIS